ncbi:MAG TPA: hypothetical protein VM406_11120, partial [Noviherbaspirillum sp.]|nr:hypothetical protein [Noviherbaspirillum sp.]
MPLPYARQLFLLCLAAAAAAPAWAQHAVPALQPLEDAGEPGTLIEARPAPRDGTNEIRMPGGRVTEIEVRMLVSRAPPAG